MKTRQRNHGDPEKVSVTLAWALDGARHTLTRSRLRARVVWRSSMTDLLQRNSSTTLHASPAPDRTRRRLLMFGAGAAGAAVATPVLASPAAIVVPVDIEANSLGYRETGHVRAYYTTTRI
jgi:hypothetical protein